MGFSKVQLSSKTDDWSTPPDLYEELNNEFHFTLDPCADDTNHKTERYFTKEMDGLAQSWDGETVFMNPPYGRMMWKWVIKASRTRGTVVCLLPARTDSMWWHDYVLPKAAEIRYIRGRLKFGGKSEGAPFPSAVVIFKNLLQ
jgi:phage N-6-adenine-methyltransferase